MDISNRKADQLDALLSRTFDFHNRSLYNVKIANNLKVTNNSDIYLDQGRGVRWSGSSIALGILNSKQSVIRYTNKILRDYVDSDGLHISANNLNIDSTYGVKWGTSESIAADTTAHNVKIYTSSTERASFDSTGLTMGAGLDIFLATTRGVVWGSTESIAGATATHTVRIYTNTTERALFDSNGITIPTTHNFIPATGYGIKWGSTESLVASTALNQVSIYCNSTEEFKINTTLCTLNVMSTFLAGFKPRDFSTQSDATIKDGSHVQSEEVARYYSSDAGQWYLVSRNGGNYFRVQLTEF